MKRLAPRVRFAVSPLPAPVYPAQTARHRARACMRFALLQLLKLQSHFFPAVQHAAWLAALREADLDAETAEFLFDPDEPEAAQLAELRAQLENQQYQVLFV